MRIVSILSALLVVATLYLVVLERDNLIAFSQGDTGALGRTAAADVVRGAFGAEPQPAPPQPEAEAPATPAPAAEAPAEPAAEQAPIAVVVQRSQVQPIDRAVVLRGRTEAAREVEVRAETSGRVVSEPLPRGSAVAEGDVLCEIDPGIRPAMLAEARARLAEAQFNSRAAVRLSEGGFASDQRTIGAEASLESAAAAVRAAEEEIDRLTLRAPFAGVLESEAAERGSLMQPGTLCATVLQLDPIRLVGFVPETRVDQIEIGAQAGARLASGRTVAGTVSFVARTADPATRTFRVEIIVANPDGLIRDGQTAEIGIGATGTDAHLVPGSALTLDDSGRLGLRIVDGEDRVRFVPVQVVRDTQQGIWITGLPETADIIVVGQEFVTEGVRVTATLREAAAAPDAGRSLLQSLDAALPAPAAEPRP
jgi:multidrug efflux system membrane fusion protein